MSFQHLRFRRAWLAYGHDLVMTACALALTVYLRVGDAAWTTYFDAVAVGIPVLVALGAVLYQVLGLYRGIWRYASLADLVQLVKAVSVTLLAFVLAMFLLGRLDTLPRSVPLIGWFVLLALLGGPRFLYRLAKDARQRSLAENDGSRIPVLLYGIGDAAEQFIRAVNVDRHAAYWVAGVIDDKGARVGREIHGVPVLGNRSQLERAVAQLAERGIRPQRLVLTMPRGTGDGAWLRALFDQASTLGMTLARLPSLTEFKDALDEGRLEPRPIAVEDLLGRPQAVLDRSAIAGLIGGRRVLVTGAGGTIGSELTRQIAALAPAELMLVENCEFNLYAIDLELREQYPDRPCRAVLADVRDRERILRLFDEFRPELVFHAAALKHVPLVEDNPCEGVLTNIIGTRNVADGARSVGVRAMVLISTDKAVRPSSVMGATKRCAESYCQALDVLPAADGAANPPTRFMTVRFGNVLGSSGSVVPLFRRQLARGGPLTVTHPEMRRYFMTVREAVELVLQASAHGVSHAGERGKIFVLDMGEPVRIVELARQMIRLAGLRPDIDVQVEFTGIRPGEKLFEEILYEAETPSRTEADGVFLASPRMINHDWLVPALARLETAAHSGDAGGTVALIHEIVPEFQTP